jgi:hypothetical protein
VSKVFFHLFIFELLRGSTPLLLGFSPLLTCTAFAACLCGAAKNHPVFVAAYLHSLCLLLSHLSAPSVLSLPVDTVANEDKVLIRALLLKIIYAEKHCHQYWVCLFLCTKLRDGSVLYIMLEIQEG